MRLHFFTLFINTTFTVIRHTHVFLVQVSHLWQVYIIHIIITKADHLSLAGLIN